MLSAPEFALLAKKRGEIDAAHRGSRAGRSVRFQASVGLKVECEVGPAALRTLGLV